jgi:hypothetical protein
VTAVIDVTYPSTGNGSPAKNRASVHPERQPADNVTNGVIFWKWCEVPYWSVGERANPDRPYKWWVGGNEHDRIDRPPSFTVSYRLMLTVAINGNSQAEKWRNSDGTVPFHRPRRFEFPVLVAIHDQRDRQRADTLR